MNFTNSIGLTLLRIVPSVMLLTHGFLKFKKMLDGNLKFYDPIGIGQSPSLFFAVIGEFVCPILIIIGFKTRWFAVPPAITLLVAAFVVHSSAPFDEKEMALLYATFFIAIILLGPGKFSIDRK